MSNLVAIIDAYKDTHGQPSDASIARAIGVAPQTISTWRRRGIRELPNPDTLQKMARFMSVPHGEILAAVLADAGYMGADEMPQLPPHGEGRKLA